MKKPWFRAKDYGWGWTPATWQGWLILLVWGVGLLFIFRDIDAGSHSGSDTLMNFFPRLILLTGLLIIVCWKTGERPTWRWGGKPTTPAVVLGWTAVLIAVFVAAMFVMRAVLGG